MSDGSRKSAGRRASDAVGYIEGIERQLADEKRRNISLSNEKSILQSDVLVLRRQINEMQRELAGLRQLQADVLTQAIQHGYDGKIRR